MKKYKGVLPCIIALLTALICLFVFPIRAQAANESDLTFTLNEDGESYCITDCKTTASGALEIPGTYDGKPVTVIGYGAFYGCDGLTSVTIPDSVTTIEFEAFCGCTGLESVSIPDSVTSVGIAAFSNCTKLTAITIPASITSINGYMFSQCTGLTSVTIPASITEIGKNAFSGCENLTDVYITDPNAWCKVNFENHEANPMCFAYYGHILDSDGNEVTRLVLDDTVTEVPYSAFSNCLNLTDVILPDSLTSIHGFAFHGCSGLTQIAIPGSITDIGDGAFIGCENLEDVYITDPNAWCKIRFVNYASNPLHFANNGYILDADGKKITELVLDTSVTAIPYCAFAKCDDLTCVVFPDSVTYIDSWAFYGCDGLTNITIPDSITAIGEEAFSNCDNLTDVYIADPNAWCKINFGNYASNPLYFAYYGHILDAEGNEVTELVLDTSVTEIPYCAFPKCDNLTQVVLPDSVTDIDDWAFYSCTGLTSILIPENVTTIGVGAFGDCSQLTTVLYRGTQEQKMAMSMHGDNSSLEDATWHYQIQEDEFAGQECYFCPLCNNYYDIAGNKLSATVVFKNWDGSILSTQSYHYGDMVTAPADPAKAADNTYTYDFAGWDRAVVDCAGNATYTATFTPQYIDYTVVFKNWDGAVLSSRTYHYGDKVTALSVPSRAADKTYTYSFKGWDQEVVDCEGDATYTATFTPNYIDYTVVFKNWNGTVLSTKTYHYGDKVTAPSNPTKAADKTYTYSFKGWDNAIVDCAGNATYTATFTPQYIDYTVVFKNWNGTVLSTKTYHYGDKVTAPADPSRAADKTYTYSFQSWNKTVVNCAGNATYTATFTPKYIDYTVVFKNWDGTELSKKTYHYGDKVTAPDTPSRPNDEKNTYTFTGWDKSVVKCAGDAAYTAVYSTKARIPSVITSSKHTVSGGVLSKIGEGITAESLLENLGEGRYAKVFRGDKAVAKNALIGTGMTVKLLDGDTVKATATVVVTGDTNGDGKITITDMLAAKAHLLQKSTLTGASGQAADTNGDGKLTITDFIQLKAHILGKSKVEPQSVVLQKMA